MATDAHAASEFYATRRGAVAARLLRERLAALWPSLAGQNVLALGYAAPVSAAVARGGGALHRAHTRAGGGGALAGWGAKPVLHRRGGRAAVSGSVLRPDPAGARSGGSGECTAAAARSLARAEGRLAACWWWPPTGAACGRTWRARRSARASRIRQDRSAACWRPRCSGWSGAIPRCTCRRPGCAWCSRSAQVWERGGRLLVPRLGRGDDHRGGQGRLRGGAGTRGDAPAHGVGGRSLTRKRMRGGWPAHPKVRPVSFSDSAQSRLPMAGSAASGETHDGPGGPRVSIGPVGP